MKNQFAKDHLSSEYSTIAGPEAAQIKIKGSRFIGHVFHVQSLVDCKKYINQQQRKYHDASHVCYAFSVGIGNQAVSKNTDAGEPQSSAGAPIQNVIIGEGLNNILVVVVRYFGGTKLGIGGLIQAYTEITKTVLAKSKRIRKSISTTIRFQISYDDLNKTLRELAKMKSKVLKQDYSGRIVMTVSIPVSALNDLKSKLVDLTSGNIEFLSK